MKTKAKRFISAAFFRRLTIILAVVFLLIDLTDTDINSYDIVRMLVYGLAINFVTDYLLTKRK